MGAPDGVPALPRGWSRERLAQVLKELALEARSIDDLAQLPLSAMQGLLSGKAESWQAEELHDWLQELKQKTSAHVKLAQVLTQLGEEGGSSVAATASAASQDPCVGIVTLKGPCSWGQLVSTANSFAALPSTSDSCIIGDHERWKVFRVGPNSSRFAFQNVATGAWLTAEPSGQVVCSPARQDGWEAWQLQILTPMPGSASNETRVALRSRHGRYLCMEPPGWPSVWPPWAMQGAVHRTATNTLHVLANRPSVREWEVFSVGSADDYPLPPAVLRQVGEHGNKA